MSIKEKKEITAKSITEKLQDVEEKKTKAQLANDKSLYNKFLKQIDTAYGKAEKAYLDIAIAIHSIYKKELYKVENFKNIYDFVKEKYNYSRGTCNKYINICENVYNTLKPMTRYFFDGDLDVKNGRFEVTFANEDKSSTAK